MQSVTSKCLKALKGFGTSGSAGMIDGFRDLELFDPAVQEPHKQATVEKAFEREALWKAYISAAKGGVKTGTRDAMVAKLECGLVSSLQKGAVLRSRSRLHCFALAASRRMAQADSMIDARLERPIAVLEGAK